jgi:CO/xanthine dehydrogenase Mo-binding subunit
MPGRSSIPDGLSNQIEGGMIQSTSWTLHEAVRFDRAAIQSRDWASYPILTMPEVPTVTVELIDRPGSVRSAPAKPPGVQWPRQLPTPSASACATCRLRRSA